MVIFRFLRHVPVVYVDYPGETSLKQIYGTFNRAMLRMIPTLRTFAEPLTNAMVGIVISSVLFIRVETWVFLNVENSCVQQHSFCFNKVKINIQYMLVFPGIWF